MRSPLSNPLRPSSNASAAYSSRLRRADERWLLSVSDSDERKRQSDNGRRQPSWQAASKTVNAAWFGLAASKTHKTTLTSTVLAKAGFFYNTPLASMTGIVKIPVKIFYAACVINATRTQKVLRPTQCFEIRQLLWCGRVLKILVSVVQFRPEPPLFTGTYWTDGLQNVPITSLTLLALPLSPIKGVDSTHQHPIKHD
jgi:hypothetical protein